VFLASCQKKTIHVCEVWWSRGLFNETPVPSTVHLVGPSQPYADFLSEKLPHQTPFPAGTPFCDTDTCEQNAHWAATCAAKRTNLSLFIVPTGKHFGCATKVPSGTKHHSPTLWAFPVAQPTYRHTCRYVHFRNKNQAGEMAVSTGYFMSL